MKNFKVAFGGAFLFLQLFSANAQNSEKPWAVGFGFNILNIQTITDSYRDLKESYIENNSNEVLFKTPFCFYGERYIGNKTSIKLMLSANNRYRKSLRRARSPESMLQFQAADLKVKIRLIDPDTSTMSFDPFLAFGGAYSRFKNTETNIITNSGKIGVGLGFVIWLDKAIGIHFQSDYNHNPLENNFDYFQHNFGITAQFGKSINHRNKHK